jgi:endonuclease/exonuclease/phosphatase family metal-dependent hydrolase
MKTGVFGLIGRVWSRTLIGVTVLTGVAAVASAQTTVTLSDPSSEVVFATIRGGAYADTNDRARLATRSADEAQDTRRAMLKFDTQHTIPAGAEVTSAVMTVTIKSGGDDASRQIAAYQVTRSWNENETTWNRRYRSIRWTTTGGDVGSKIDDAEVGNTAGKKVNFDVTRLVKLAVAGKLGSSRYTRLMLVDVDGATADSYREFVTPTGGNDGNRPVLTVTYGGKKPKPTSPPPSPSGGETLRVLHWNTHHGGVGTDGKWNPDRFIEKAASFDPDVVSLNEVEHYNVDQPALFASLMKKYTGVTWYYKYTSGTGTQSGIGNMIMSRFELDATDIQPLSNGRAAVVATIKVNGRAINVASTHLDNASGSARIQEIGELTAWARGFAEQRIICGDFNAWPGSTENATMKKAYKDSWAEALADDLATAYPGNSAGNTRNSRIDYIYYSHDAGSLVLTSSQVFDTRDSHGVMPSDHRPLLSVFTVY